MPRASRRSAAPAPDVRDRRVTIEVMGVVAWAGGAAFVASLGYFAYTYAVSLATTTSGAPAPIAGAIDVLLFLFFALHHSVFARPRLKRWTAGLVGARLQRSAFVWLASGLLAVTCAAWQPLPGILYHQAGLAAWPHLAAVTAGLALTAISAFRLDPLDLAGIRQAKPRPGHGQSAELVTGFPYNLVRHPIYLGWALMVFGVPLMTWNRFLMATLSTSYLVVAVSWEERQLTREFGPKYEAYQRKVRWRIVPGVY